jgi:hypothetical protein
MASQSRSSQILKNVAKTYAILDAPDEEDQGAEAYMQVYLAYAT